MMADPEGLQLQMTAQNTQAACSLYPAACAALLSSARTVAAQAAAAATPIIAAAAPMIATGGAALGTGLAIGYYGTDFLAQCFSNETAEEKEQRCTDEWAAARERCSGLLELPDRERPSNIWGGSYGKCVMGQVSQSCGGNRVDR